MTPKNKSENDAVSIRLPQKELNLPLLVDAGVDEIKQACLHFKHEHECLEFVFVFRGERSIQLGDSGFLHLKGGNFAMIQPGTPHGDKKIFMQPSKYLWILFDPSGKNANKLTPVSKNQLSDFATRFAALGNIQASTSPRMTWLAEELDKVNSQIHEKGEDEFSLPWLRSLVSTILLEGLRLAEMGKEKSLSYEIQGSLRYMQLNMHRNLSMDELAEKSGLGLRRFYDRFRHEVGLTPADALIRLRCEKARELLTLGEESITDIALSLGFSNSAYFSSVFKKYTGMSPSGYKKSSAKSA